MISRGDDDLHRTDRKGGGSRSLVVKSGGTAQIHLRLLAGRRRGHCVRQYRKRTIISDATIEKICTSPSLFDRVLGDPGRGESHSDPDQDKLADQKVLKALIESELGRGRTLTDKTVAAWLRARVEAPVYIDVEIIFLRREGGALLKDKDKTAEKAKKLRKPGDALLAPLAPHFDSWGLPAGGQLVE
jgi:hypothetical protein